MVDAALWMLAVLALLFVGSRLRRRASERRLLQAFGSAELYIGKRYQEVVDRLGRPSSEGAMDHGQYVACWRAGRVSIEAWFRNDVCESIG